MHLSRTWCLFHSHWLWSVQWLRLWARWIMSAVYSWMETTILSTRWVPWSLLGCRKILSASFGVHAFHFPHLQNVTGAVMAQTVPQAAELAVLMVTVTLRQGIVTATDGGLLTSVRVKLQVRTTILAEFTFSTHTFFCAKLMNQLYSWLQTLFNVSILLGARYMEVATVWCQHIWHHWLQCCSDMEDHSWPTKWHPAVL